jgi:cell division protein FtsZ
VLINITGGPDLSLHEVNEAATLIQEEADDDANIIFGAVIDESMGDEVRITVIATGFGEAPAAVCREAAVVRRASNGPVASAGDAGPVKPRPPAGGRARRADLAAAAAGAAGRCGAQCAAARGASAAEEAGEDYDVPTFLRRGAE